MQFNVSHENKSLPKHEFDLLATSQRCFINVALAEETDAFRLFEFLDDYLCLADNQVGLIQELIGLNKKGVFLFEKDQQISGFYAMQMLNPIGLDALLYGEFDGSLPLYDYVADYEDEPAGIYVWGYIAPGLAANGVRNVSHFLQEPQFQKANIYARPVTNEGQKITLDFGFEKINSYHDNLYCYTRLVNRYYC